MKVVFSTAFKRDLLEAEVHYNEISKRLCEDFRLRVQETALLIERQEGGDHVGPHGFPSRKCRPFPYIVYYQKSESVIYILALIHEKRHPEYLAQRENV
jgi:hypothetical protein